MNKINAPALLTGLLLALLSQGYAPEAAALIGVHLHGAAADCATAQHGHPTALIASDIPKFFGQAIQLTVENFQLSIVSPQNCSAAACSACLVV